MDEPEFGIWLSEITCGEISGNHIVGDYGIAIGFQNKPVARWVFGVLCFSCGTFAGSLLHLLSSL